MNHQPARFRRLRSSRQRYRAFVQDYRHRRLDDKTEADGEQQPAIVRRLDIMRRDARGNSLEARFNTQREKQDRRAIGKLRDAPARVGEADELLESRRFQLLRLRKRRGQPRNLTETIHPHFEHYDGFITAPRGGFFNLDGQWDVENTGVTPDIAVEQTPSDLVRGRDPQLERAVQEALRLLQEKPELLKPEPAPPVRVRRP